MRSSLESNEHISAVDIVVEIDKGSVSVEFSLLVVSLKKGTSRRDSFRTHAILLRENAER